MTNARTFAIMITKLANKVIKHLATKRGDGKMARGTYDETHQKILESGMRMFLENGYERTNLRDLCADAGITTGSFYRHFDSKEALFSYFVQPAVTEITQLFTASEICCENVLEEGQVLKLWDVVSAEALVDLIYRHFDRLKLLLKCADGTPYNCFLNDVVCMEAKLSTKFLTEAKARGMIQAELPSEDEMHMICHAYVSSLFESVMHDFSKDAMVRYIHTMTTFFSGGAKTLLDL